MNIFFKKLKKMELKHMHELSVMCGSVALLLIAAIFVSAGVPKVVHAWTIPIYYLNNTPVEQGGNTTISWYASSAQFCTLSGATLPCVTYNFFHFYKWKVCSVTTYGTNPGSINQGSVNTGPVTGPTSYALSCYSPKGCSWGCHDGNGSAAITVYPTAPAPTSLTSFTVSPSTVIKGNKATISWSGTKGTHFSSCELAGGQYGSGTWFTTLPGSVPTNALSTTTTYSMDCIDTTGAQTGWKSATATVVAPLGPCDDIPSQPTVPNGCVTPNPEPGICIPTGGSYSSQTNTCSCPSGTHLSGSACVANPLCSNGLADSYAPSCKCPSGQYQPLGVSSCVALPVCTNGLSQSYSPNCTCPAGQVQNGSSCIDPGTITSFTATPNRVQKGTTTTISWVTTNMATCSLSELAASGASSAISSALQGALNPKIDGQTIFTLSCTDKAGENTSTSQTVNIIPIIIEQ